MAGYTHNEGFSSKSNGYAVGKAGSESTVIAQDGTLYQKKVEITATAAELNKLASAGAVVASGTQATLITDPTGGTTTDAEARAAVNSIIDALQAFGIVKTS